MLRDAIVDEVREIRHKTEEACQRDWKKLMDHYRRVEPGTASLVRGQPKRLPPTPVKKTREEK